ncbi:Gamma-glutamylaminecyclotransferase B [Triplophysa tibetana]|uniref:Gamma-glutamylaminecyclotransferase n=1 Tax=Triplophysa tibetana TaxID=1572043 RepID=A0A5A9PLK6_9TELE|nr:Gamma-glutamylaminecyclotransferase B [Triplophysa tibetana]
MTLIRHRYKVVILKLFICAQFHDHLRFKDFTSGRPDSHLRLKPHGNATRASFPLQMTRGHYYCCGVEMTRVFVYGTLKKGQPNDFRMLDTTNGTVKFLARARTVDPYPLVIATRNNIPFMLNKPGKGQRVRGEIYEVDDKMLQFLDMFEDCPEMYQRTLVQLEVEECAGEDEDKLKTGSIIESFVYTTTTYKPEWLEYPTYENYDTHGDHGLKYVDRNKREPDLQ